MSRSFKLLTNAVAVIACAVLFAGCGGGSSVAPAALAPQPQDQGSGNVPQERLSASGGHVTFTIAIPAKPATQAIRHAQYISPSTQSLAILTDGANPTIVNVPFNCPPNPNVPGSHLCTAQLFGLSGNHVFTVTAYDQVGAKGNVLSTNSTGTIYVKPVGMTTISLVLEGAVAYVVLSLATTNPPVGTPATVGLTPILEDAQHDIIVGPALYEHPVTLTTTDPANGALSKTTLNSPADSAGITVRYSGANVASITYAATATGLGPASVTVAVLKPGSASHDLYVANLASCANIIVDAFDLANLTNPPNAIPTGASCGASASIAVDKTGKLYIVDSVDGEEIVRVIGTAHGNAVLPSIDLGSGALVQAMTVDTNGKLYLAQFGNGSPVLVYDTAHGNVQLPGFDLIGDPFGIAIDSSGTLYVSEITVGSPGNIFVFDTIHDVALPTITGTPQNQSGLAIGADGKLYDAVTPSTGVGYIAVFDTAHGNAALPALPIAGALSGIEALAIDPTGKLYVPVKDLTAHTASVLVFDTAHGNTELPAISLGVDVRGIGGIALR